MKRTILVAAIALLGLPGTALADEVEDLKAAVSKLADSTGYSWNQSIINPKNRTSVEGKTKKEGVTWLVMKGTSGDREYARKGDKTAYKSPDGWKVMTTREGPDKLMPGVLPSDAALAFIAAFKELKAGADGQYTGELLDDQTKEMIHLGGSKPAASGGIVNAKGTVKFKVKDGVLVKIEARLTGHSTVAKMEIEHDKNITFEIKDIGTVKFEVPAEAYRLLD